MAAKRSKSAPPETETDSIRVTLPAPVFVWVRGQAEEHYRTTAGYVRDLLVAHYRRSHSPASRLNPPSSSSPTDAH